MADHSNKSMNQRLGELLKPNHLVPDDVAEQVSVALPGVNAGLLAFSAKHKDNYCYACIVYAGNKEIILLLKEGVSQIVVDVKTSPKPDPHLIIKKVKHGEEMRFKLHSPHRPIGQNRLLVPDFDGADKLFQEITDELRKLGYNVQKI